MWFSNIYLKKYKWNKPIVQSIYYGIQDIAATKRGQYFAESEDGEKIDLFD